MLRPQTSRFWLLGQLNVLLDSGTRHDVNIDAAKDAIRSRSVDKWLTELSDDGIDLSPLTSDDWNSLHDDFEHLIDRIDERRMGIERNGVCLLIAYLLDDLLRNLRHPTPSRP